MSPPHGSQCRGEPRMAARAEVGRHLGAFPSVG